MAFRPSRLNIPCSILHRHLSLLDRWSQRIRYPREGVSARKPQGAPEGDSRVLEGAYERVAGVSIVR
jgi:hypothetical protein